MSERLFINVVGEPASGKGKACRRLSQLGCAHIVPSDIIKAYAASKEITLNGRKSFADTHRMMLNENDLSMVLPMVRLADTTNRVVTIEGLRVMNNLRRLSHYGHVINIGLQCSDEERYRRACKEAEERGNKDNLTSLEEFLAGSADESYNPNPDESSIRSVLDIADYLIDTTHMSVPRLNETIDNIYALL